MAGLVGSRSDIRLFFPTAMIRPGPIRPCLHFQVAVRGFPGYLQYESDSKINALQPLCMYMHVGERDPEWLAPMQRQFESFREKGFHVRFRIEADEGHGIQGLAGEGAKRLFDQLEEAARGCQF